MNEELLYNDIYEKTKECGRTQFVRLLMDKEREIKQLKRKLEKSEISRKEAIEYVKKRNFDRAEILVDMECEYYYDDDFKDSLLYILEKE